MVKLDVEDVDFDGEIEFAKEVARTSTSRLVGSYRIAANLSNLSDSLPKEKKDQVPLLNGRLSCLGKSSGLTEFEVGIIRRATSLYSKGIKVRGYN